MAKGCENYPKDRYVKNDGMGSVKPSGKIKSVGGSEKMKTGRAGGK